MFSRLQKDKKRCDVCGKLIIWKQIMQDIKY